MIGNLTRDPELNTTANNISVCKFTVAVTRRFANADGTRETDFLPVVCWRGQAENCGRYLKKGSKVGICGSIQTRSYEASDGTRRYVTEINADEVQFLSSRGDWDNAEELPEVTEANAKKTNYPISSPWKTKIFPFKKKIYKE